MDVKDVIALARAGFNIDQISTISSALSQPEQPEQKPEQVPAQQPGPVQAQAAPVGDQTAAILERLGVISNQLTNAAINNSQQPAPQTADDILAAIIAPPRRE